MQEGGQKFWRATRTPCDELIGSIVRHVLNEKPGVTCAHTEVIARRPLRASREITLSD